MKGEEEETKEKEEREREREREYLLCLFLLVVSVFHNEVTEGDKRGQGEERGKVHDETPEGQEEVVSGFISCMACQEL